MVAVKSQTVVGCVQGLGIMMNDDASWSSNMSAINLTVDDRPTTSGNDTSAPVSLAMQVAVGTVLSTLCLITVLGNTLVIHAVRTDRKLQTVSITHCDARCFLLGVCVLSVRSSSPDTALQRSYVPRYRDRLAIR